MKKPRVLVVFKESAYAQYHSSTRLLRVLKKGRYWSILKGSHQRHNETLEGVKAILKAEGLPLTFVLRDQLRRLKGVDRRFDLLVSVGGDGTLLDSSHLVRKIPGLGVNSDPQRSVARFSGCTLETFQSVLKSYLEGKIRPVPISRLELWVNGRKCPWLVLNDLLVAALSPAGTSRYVLEVGRRGEEQMSSGVWISTAAGSTAAAFSAGGRVLPVASRDFQYVVREVYQKKFGKRRLVKGTLKPGRSLEMVSYMKEGRVFVDGANLVLPFRLGDRLKVGVSREPLRVVGLRG